MGIDYSGMMIVGIHYDDLPAEIQEQDDIWEWIEEQGLDVANEWYDSGTDGMIIGISMSDVSKDDLDTWFLDLKNTFVKVEKILKKEPTLIGTQDIY